MRRVGWWYNASELTNNVRGQEEDEGEGVGEIEGAMGAAAVDGKWG